MVYLTSKLFLERLKSHVADTYEDLFIFRIVNVVLSLPFLWHCSKPTRKVSFLRGKRATLISEKPLVNRFYHSKEKIVHSRTAPPQLTSNSRQSETNFTKVNPWIFNFIKKVAWKCSLSWWILVFESKKKFRIFTPISSNNFRKIEKGCVIPLWKFSRESTRRSCREKEEEGENALQ